MSKKATITTSDQEETIVFYFVRHIMRNILWILIIGALVAVGGYIYAAQKKPVYESYVSFALEGAPSGNMSRAMGIASQLGISFGGGTDIFAGDNILRIIMSRRMIEASLLSVDTVDNHPMTLIEFYLYRLSDSDKNTESKNDIHFIPGESRKNFSYAQDRLLYQTYLKFKQNYIIARRPEKDLNIYEVMVKSGNEKFAKVFTDTLIEKTIDFYTHISSQKAKETLEILEKRVPAMKSKLDESISAKASLEDANLNTTFAKSQVSQIKELSDSKVYGSAYSELFKNLEIARFQYLKSIPLLQIIDDAHYPMKKIKSSKIVTGFIFGVVAVFITLMLFLFIDFLKLIRQSTVENDF